MPSHILAAAVLVALAVLLPAAAACSNDAGCRSTQFCHFGNCVSKRSNGDSCDLINGDRQCDSTFCDFGRCVACKEDSHCGAGRFCTDAKACRNRLSVSSSCSRDGMCESRICKNSICSQCRSGISECPAAQYCAGVTCQPRKPLDADCSLIAGDAECLSGRCNFGKCVECLIHENCPSDKYCGFSKRCFDRKVLDAPCPFIVSDASDRECASNSCLGGKCVRCRDDSKCVGIPAMSQAFCVTNDPDGLNGCRPKHNNGLLCDRPAKCRSGICKAGKCAACDNHSQCTSRQYCGATECETRKPLGSSCPRIDGNRQCASGFCDAVTQTCKSKPGTSFALGANGEEPMEEPLEELVEEEVGQPAATGTEAPAAATSSATQPTTAPSSAPAASRPSAATSRRAAADFLIGIALTFMAMGLP
ncbi:hypothetical protein DFJ74DRAFT_702459 [Hyaloraphidium curvatum]|nr:hypothetical protein DFJ74DRAFT_702459 [Hyaloraphidium curvatum]